MNAKYVIKQNKTDNNDKSYKLKLVAIAAEGNWTVM